MKRKEELDEIFRKKKKNSIGLKDILNWFVETYPEDIFQEEPKDIITIRESAKRLLKGKW